jgi:hypothetical protein
MTNLTHYRGDTLSRLITITNSNGTALNLTGYTAFFTIKNISDNSADDSSAILAKNWTTHSDPVNGQTLLTATPAQMTIDEGTYKYDVQIKSPAGDITTVIAGNISILEDITKRIV